MVDEPGQERGPRGFQIRRRLGAGGFGTVYEAFDERHRSTVALKMLHRQDPQSLCQFKLEFRTLADVVHPNLVTFFQLMCEDERWFITMELIPGARLLNFLGVPRYGSGEGEDKGSGQGAAAPKTVSLRGKGTGSGRAAGETASGRRRRTTDHSHRTRPVTAVRELRATPEELAAAEEQLFEPPQRPVFTLDEARLRRTFLQLAQGVQALHAAHILHRDLKPANVLCTPEERVVLLDFGLAKLLRPAAPPRSTGILMGTPVAMAPELWREVPESQASDWYSVGVMLYEALSGRLPFTAADGRLMLNDKLTRPPVPVSELIEGAPADLETLCQDLLQREPAARPTGEEVLERLARGKAGARGPTVWPRRASTGALIGRGRELAALKAAFEEVSAGQAVLVRIHGASGIGKTSLVREFLEALEARDAALVLAGRCHEQESFPYKGFDSLIDALYQFLLSLSPDERRDLVPPGSHELCRLFPVLKEVVEAEPREDGGASEAGARDHPASPEGEVLPDLQQQRRHAFRALKELLRRLATRRALVLWLDDLQWGDLDSAHLLTELLSPPDVPPLLLVASYLKEEEKRSPCLGELGRLWSAPADAIRTHEIGLGPLPCEEARELAARRLQEVTAAASLSQATSATWEAWEDVPEVVARESEGNPFFVEELIRSLEVKHEDGEAPPLPSRVPHVSLREVILSRFQRLPEGPRRLLEVTAVAGHPLDEGIALSAAALDEGSLGALVLLRSGGLLRWRVDGQAMQLELGHNRIRESIHAQLDVAVRRDHHRRLAESLAAALCPDAELLVHHYEGAGDLVQAMRYAMVAAEHADEAFAFARAAELYGRALAWSREAPEAARPERCGLLIRYADALARSGRCAEAAVQYLAAADESTPERALALRQQAAEQYLVSGHLDAGLGVLTPIFKELGVGLPASKARAGLRMLRLALELLIRNWRFNERNAAEVDPRDLLRIDACWSLYEGLSHSEPVTAVCLLLESTCLALRAGEPGRVAQGLCSIGVMMLVTGKPWALARGTALLARGEALAERLDNPLLLGLISLYESSRSQILGRWGEALAHIERAQRLLLQERSSVRFQRQSFIELIAFAALEALGRLKDLGDRAALWEREAQEMGDLYASWGATLHRALARIAAGEVDEARRRVREVIARWSRRDFLVQHMEVLRIEAYGDLYEGRPLAAYARVRAAWPAIRASQLLQVQFTRLKMLLLHARSAIASAEVAAHGGRSRFLAEAEDDARRLEREVRSDAQAAAHLLRAGIARVRGDKDAALVHLDAAIQGYQAAEMALDVACARRAQGMLIGGDQGRALVAEADAFMASQGIHHPQQWLSVQAPGFSAR
jgi:tetratricopeptide (TPR) repeat protein